MCFSWKMFHFVRCSSLQCLIGTMVRERERGEQSLMHSMQLLCGWRCVLVHSLLFTDKNKRNEIWMHRSHMVYTVHTQLISDTMTMIRPIAFRRKTLFKIWEILFWISTFERTETWFFASIRIQSLPPPLFLPCDGNGQFHCEMESKHRLIACIVSFVCIFSHVSRSITSSDINICQKSPSFFAISILSQRHMSSLIVACVNNENVVIRPPSQNYIARN